MNPDFDTWVRNNFTGQRMDAPPEDFDPTRELFYRIDDLQHRIPFTAIPDQFLTKEEQKIKAQLTKE